MIENDKSNQDFCKRYSRYCDRRIITGTQMWNKFLKVVNALYSFFRL